MSVVVRWAGGEIEWADHSDALHGAPRGAVTAAKISLATRDAERALTAEIRGLA